MIKKSYNVITVLNFILINYSDLGVLVLAGALRDGWRRRGGVRWGGGSGVGGVGRGGDLKH